MITLICVFFLITSLMLSVVFYKRIFFNPPTVFFGIWFFNLMLYELDDFFGFFYYKLSSFAEIILFFSFISFFLGSFTMVLNKNIHRTDRPLHINESQLKLIYRITKILLLLYLAAALYKYIILFQIYGNPFASLGAIRIDFIQGTYAYPTYLYLFTLPVYLIGLNLGVLVVFYPNKKTLFMMLTTLILAFLNDASIGARGSTFSVILLLVSTILLTIAIKHNRLRMRYILGGIGAIMGGVLLLTTILWLRGGMNFGFAEAALSSNYLYIAGTIPAFSYFLENPWPSTFPGYYAFGGIYRLADTILGAFGISFLSQMDKATLYAEITTIGPFNSSGHLTYYHSDFGILGVIICTYLLGAISSYLFTRAVYFKRIIDVQLLGLMLATIIFTIRGILTNGPFFWVTLFGISLQYILTRPPKTQ